QLSRINEPNLDDYQRPNAEDGLTPIPTFTPATASFAALQVRSAPATRASPIISRIFLRMPFFSFEMVWLQKSQRISPHLILQLYSRQNVQKGKFVDRASRKKSCAQITCAHDQGH
ncbi:MAG TPA: hypothetical protein VMJ66_03905, partial [Geobacteraceae bacterium]|nr:hypothetical protein [Geobacteraceae bacterium]